MATWVKGPKTSDKPFPSNAYPACFMENGDIAYVARGTVEGQLVNGYTTRSGLQACLSYAKKEHWVGDYEILVTDTPEKFCWHGAENGNVPENAVPGGTDNNETTYIGRSCKPYKDAEYDNVPEPSGFPARYIPIASRLGKIHPCWSRLYFAYQGTEYSFATYEVLCSK